MLRRAYSQAAPAATLLVRERLAPAAASAGCPAALMRDPCLRQLSWVTSRRSCSWQLGGIVVVAPATGCRFRFGGGRRALATQGGESPGSHGDATGAPAGSGGGARAGDERRRAEDVAASGGRPSDDKYQGPDLGPDRGEMKKGSDNVQFTWRSAIFTTAVCAACLAYYEFLKRRKENNARASVTNERIGTPKLGGPFELVDRKGKTVTDKDFLGQYLLIYFGFTFCPDICPQEMEKQTHAIEIIEKEFGPIATPIFISVDPSRDKPAQVDDYCNEFHPRIQGLTGTPEQVKAVSRAYRVYFNEGLRNSDEDYLIDHSIIHYFIGRNGKFCEFFGKNMTAQEMATTMRTTILEDREKAKQRKERRGVESADEE